MTDEYISREAMLEHLDRCKQSEDATTLTAAVITALQCFVQSQPAADVVPVVRCQDCKHAWIHPCGYVYCHRDGRNAYEMTFNLDSFCSYGERKDNG